MVIKINYIKNPELNIISAPYVGNIHTKFNKIDCIDNIVFYSFDIETLDETFKDIEKHLNEDGFETYVTNNKKILYKGKNNYIINNFDFLLDKKIYIAVTNIFETSELIFDNDYKEKTILKLSEYNYTTVTTHKGEIVNSGIINTNNKLTSFSWNINNIELFEKVYYEVSLWKDNKLLKIYNTKQREFVFAEHALKESDGFFELIVVAKDLYGSSSLPSSYRFNLKTKIVDDFKITIVNDYLEESNISNLSSPKFKIYPYEKGYDYKIYLNNKIYSYLESIENQKEYFQLDDINKCLYFYCPDILSDGRYLLNMEKIDNIGNKTGNYINPLGKHGTTFLNFLICTVFSPAPELIDFYWINSTDVFINWKSQDSAKTYRIYQNSTLLAETEKTFITFKPILEEGKDLNIDIISYDYMGKPSEKPCRVLLKKYSDVINNITINKTNFIFTNNSYFTNNPNPLFEWNINDSSKLKYYKVSLDGSNWFKIIDNKFLFNNYLINGIYTFRIVAVNKNDIPGIINTFTFNLQTNKTSMPVFDRETINLKPRPIEKIKISWLKVKNNFKYNYIFNETLITKETKRFETFDNFVELKKHKDILKVGINSISIQSTDIFGNSSDFATINFIITDNKKREVGNFNLTQIDNKSNELKYTWQLPEFEENTFCKLFLVDPKDIDREIIDEFNDREFTNTINFDIDGMWYIELEWYKRIGENIISLNKTDKIYHLYNSYDYDIINFSIDKEILTWQTSKISNYNYFKYSIASEHSEYLEYKTTYSNTLDLTNKLLAGKYKINIISYSVNNLETDNKEFIFEIFKEYNYKEKEIILTEELKATVNIFKNTNTFIIKDIKDISNNIKKGILMYKKINETDYTFYEENFPLIINENYNFIYNEVVID